MSDLYPWVKSFHIISVICWMAGLLYLPRLFVNHVEQLGLEGVDRIFLDMERKLLRIIMNPAMIATWFFGGMLLFTPGLVSFSDYWIWAKLLMVLIISWYHHWLAARYKGFLAGTNRLSSKAYRLMNEVPTIAMIIIVLMVVIRPF